MNNSFFLGQNKKESMTQIKSKGVKKNFGMKE